MSARGVLLPSALAAGLLAASVGLGRAADAARVPEARAARGLPPLGAINLLAVDLLWIRADALFTEGRWPEMLAAYEAAGRVEPRLSASWEYRGFHLAYNLAGSAAEEEDRDRWVVEGVRMLEDGLRRNPSSQDLRAYLGYVLAERSSFWPSARKRLGAARGVDPLDDAVKILSEAVAAEPDYAKFAIWKFGALLARARSRIEAARPGQYVLVEDLGRADEVLRSLLLTARPEAKPILDGWAAAVRDLRRAAETTDPEERRRILHPDEVPPPGGK